MAYDKVVDSAALDAVFTGIANGLRGITGETGTIKDTEMQGKISGIGAEVSNQTDLIEQIKAALEGKGGGEGSKIETGTFTPASNVTTYTVPNSIGSSLGDTSFFVAAMESVTISLKGILCCGWINKTETDKNGSMLYTVGNGSNGYYTGVGLASSFPSITAENVTFKGYFYNSVFESGVKYYYILWSNDKETGV